MLLPKIVISSPDGSENQDKAAPAAGTKGGGSGGDGGGGGGEGEGEGDYELPHFELEKTAMLIELDENDEQSEELKMFQKPADGSDDSDLEFDLDDAAAAVGDGDGDDIEKMLLGDPGPDKDAVSMQSDASSSTLARPGSKLGHPRTSSAKSSVSARSARSLRPGAPSESRVASARKVAMQANAKKARKRRMRARPGKDDAHDLALGVASSGKKVKKLMAKMQLSNENLARITMSFKKFDPEGTALVDKDRLALIMEDLGRKPESNEELDSLFRQTDKDASGLITFDEFVSMMVLRVGFRATPGVMITVTSLEFAEGYLNAYDSKRRGSGMQPKRKGSCKRRAPQLELHVAGCAPVAIKGTKERSTTFGLLYDQKAFLACPNPCTEPCGIEAIGDQKQFRFDGRLLKDVIGCNSFDLDQMSDQPTTITLPLYKPLDTNICAVRRNSDLSSAGDLSAVSNQESEEARDNEQDGKAKPRRPSHAESHQCIVAPDLGEQVGTLHLTARRHLREAKETFADSTYTNEDMGGPDASQEEYELVQTRLKRMVRDVGDAVDAVDAVDASPYGSAFGGGAAGGELTRTDSWFKAKKPEDDLDLVWASLDFQGLGLIPLDTVRRYIIKQLPLLNDMPMLLTAYRTMLASKRQYFEDFTSIAADRRCWVAQRDFGELLCNLFFLKRFWEIYEIIADSKEVKAGREDAFAPHVDVREFSYIAKRAGQRLSEHEVEMWFEACLPVGSEAATVPLVLACHMAASKVFFPSDTEYEPPKPTRSEKHKDRSRRGMGVAPPKSGRARPRGTVPKSGRRGHDRQSKESVKKGGGGFSRLKQTKKKPDRQRYSNDRKR